MINYSIVSKKNPVSKQVTYHAQSLSTSPIALATLAKDISAQCTVTVHDVKAVLSALEEHITRALQNGNSVRLGDLGSFHVTLCSRGAATKEEFGTELIERVRVRFVCSAAMRSSFELTNKEITFKKVALGEGEESGGIDPEE